VSQGLAAAGVAAVLLMGLGTAITVGVLAAVATSFRGITQGLLGGQSRWTPVVLSIAELAGAVVVTMFGLVLLLASFSG
jgi:nickel/cobalt exporter